ncbi:MAG: BrnT family toxin [Pirellulales bacterium]|nr:BrnT family toxin [Pirellulales bacterium]
MIDPSPETLLSSAKTPKHPPRRRSRKKPAAARCLSHASPVGYNESMRLEWDERKNQANIQKHGLDFADAGEIFSMPVLIALDDREDYGEDRWIGIGLLKTFVVVVVYVERDEDVIRIISLRKALSHERAEYERILQNRLGPDWRHER